MLATLVIISILFGGAGAAAMQMLGLPVWASLVAYSFFGSACLLTVASLNGRVRTAVAPVTPHDAAYAGDLRPKHPG